MRLNRLTSRSHLRLPPTIFVSVFIFLSLTWPVTSQTPQPRNPREALERNQLLRRKELFAKAIASGGLNANTIATLKSAEIDNFTDLRKRLYSKDKEPLGDLPAQELKKLRSASLLSLLSTDLELNAGLAKANFGSLADLEKLDPDDLVRLSNNKLDQKDAIAYRTKVQALRQLINQRHRMLAANIKNPSPLYPPGGLDSDTRELIRRSVSATGAACARCGETTNLFSPAVYLLYLLDFIEKSFGTHLDSLEKINSRFKQKFEDIAIAQVIDASESYVLYTNHILENLIAEMSGKKWPNEIVDSTEADARFEIKVAVYEEFKKSKYHDEPGFDPDVLVRLFDAYVRELGTTRREVRFIRLGSPRLQANFVEEHDLLSNELTAIEKSDEEITLKEIEDVRSALLAYHQRKEHAAVKEEFISDIEDATRRTFERHLRSLRADEVQKVTLELVAKIDPAIDPASEDYDRALLDTSGLARACVELGESCPSGSESPVGARYAGNPLNPLWELYRSHATDYPEYTGSDAEDSSDRTNFADTRAADRETQIEDERYAELLAEAAAEGAVTPARRDELRQQAKAFAEDRVRSEGEFDHQLHALAEHVFNSELTTPANAEAFDFAVNRRRDEHFRTASSKANTGFLAQIRSNLIIIALEKIQEDTTGKYPTLVPFGEIVTTTDNVEALANYAFLDLSMDETTRTTGLAFAISRIHTFVQDFRLGVLTEYTAANFNEGTWNWLSSYGLFHAAMMVSSYPENFLIPDVRRTKTAQFDTLLQQDSMDVQTLVDSYAGQLSDFRGMGIMNTVSIEGKVFVFARASNQNFYYSVLKLDQKWTGWRRVPGASIPSRGFTRRLEVVQKDGFLHLFILAKEIPSHEPPLKYKLMYLTLPIAGDSLGGSQASAETESDQESDSAWTELFEFEVSGATTPLFAIGWPGLQASTYVRVVVVAPMDKFLYRTVWLDQNGKLLSDGDSSSAEVDGGTHPPSGLPLGLVIANGDVRSVQNVPNLFLWDDTFGLYLGPTHESVNDPSKQIPGVGGGPPLAGFRGYGALSPIGSENNFLLFSTASDLAWVTLFEVRTQAGAIQAVSQGILEIPEGNLTGKAFALLQSHWLLFASPTHKDTWKEYYFDFNTGRLSNLSLPSDPPIGSNGTTMNHFEPLISEIDDVRIYLEEYFLHIPLYIADYLNENKRFEEAAEWLAKIYDPFQSSEPERIRYPDLLENTGANGTFAIGSWLEDPFDPFALAELNKQSYLVATKLAHVSNYLDWADHLFVRDTTESVNRARELYKLAGSILGMHEWPRDDCELAWHAFRSDLEDDDPEVIKASILAPQWVAGISHEIVEEARKTLLIETAPVFRAARLECLFGDFETGAKFDFIMGKTEEAEGALEEDLALADLPEEGLTDLGDVTIGDELPPWMPGFCLPVNPLVNLYRWRIVSNLEKIRTNRNFAGIQRQMQPYATPVDPKKLVKQAAAGGIDFEQFVPSEPPPIYRYSFLIERARYLVSVAQQFEGSMLSSLEKADAESYSLMRARQDLRLDRANVTLQALRVKEASDSLSLAQKQLERTEFQKDHYETLISEGPSADEQRSIVLQAGAQLAYFAATWKEPTGAGAAMNAAASIAATKASWQRRRQEWQFQLDTARYDVSIADIGIDLAQDRVDIVSQEQSIATIRLEAAGDTVEFLGTKFTNAPLYRWMNKNLRKLYREQLNMAIATAKAAQRALEFERQTSLDFIGFDYWDDEKQGLLGAEQLMRDTEKMEQHRVSTASRKKEIEKTISLAAVAPVAFQNLKRTGVLNFETLPDWFERDFPGHYMRLVRDISVTVIALVPPNEGIHATLSNPGLSRVMTGPPFEEPAVIYRLPESVALSGAQRATGMFELRPEDPMLLPFEGSGVATTWQLEMPKGANRFDFDTIVDILFTIRYTALEDRSYRDKVLANMGQDEEGYVRTDGVRVVSLKREFPDQWYLLHNPSLGLEEADYLDVPKDIQCDEPIRSGKPLPHHTMVIELNEKSFLPNEDSRRINDITVAIQMADKAGYEDEAVTFNVSFISDNCSPKQHDSVRVASIGSTDKMNSKAPYGKWVLQLDTSDTSNELIYPPGAAGSTPEPEKVDISWLQDVFLIIDYRARVHYNR